VGHGPGDQLLGPPSGLAAVSETLFVACARHRALGGGDAQDIIGLLLTDYYLEKNRKRLESPQYRIVPPLQIPVVQL